MIDDLIPIIEQLEFKSVLDIGPGKDFKLAKYFSPLNKKVSSFDMIPRTCSDKFLNWESHRIIFDIRGFEETDLDEQFDLIVVSHVMEHIEDTGIFLTNVYNHLKPNGTLVIAVPPFKHNVVGGHVTPGWNIGILMYNLILNKFNVHEGSFKALGYNIIGIVKKSSINLPNTLEFNAGDIDKLKDYFPKDEYFKQGFDGNLKEWNWK